MNDDAGGGGSMVDGVEWYTYVSRMYSNYGIVGGVTKYPR